MDKRRQSILKQDGRLPLQETVIPDFPEEDTATVTVTKSRRVSFGANFVKEFIIGSAVSAQFFSEYEQTVSSSDSSNQNTSRSGIIDKSEDDVLNLCMKRGMNNDEMGPLKKKLNLCNEENDKNNENIWDFNVSNSSNIFTEKNMGCQNKSEIQRNSVKCSKKTSLLNESSVMDKQLPNKIAEPDLNTSKMDETEKKSKVGKFSSTIFFSADSPTADVEFTEGCISLAKSILGKKKQEMTVYIKGTQKDGKKGDGNNTLVFESDDSNVGMKLTKCVDESESEKDMTPGNFSKFFPSQKDDSDDFDESHENIENVPFHMYSLRTMLAQDENSQDDAELERSLFFPERSLTEMLHSDPLKTTVTQILSEEKDNTEICDMEISSPQMLRSTILDGDLKDKEEEETYISPISPNRANDEEDIDCSPVFSKVTVGEDLSCMSDNTESELPDPLKLPMYEDKSLNEGSEPDTSNCCPLKISVTTVEEEVAKAAEDQPSNSSSSNVEDIYHSGLKKEPEEAVTLENHDKSEVCDGTKEAAVVEEEEEDLAVVETVGKKDSSFIEDNESLALFAEPKFLTADEFPLEEKDEEENQSERCEKPVQNDGNFFDAEENVRDRSLPKEISEETFDVKQNEKSCLQDTQFSEESLLSRTICVDGISLGDKEILSLLKEQSEESNCCWTIDPVCHKEDNDMWSFSFPILKSSGIMKFKLMPPKDKSIVSFSIVLYGCLELQESNEYQLEKHRIGIEYTFGKLKTIFLRESHGLDNVHKMPLFLDKMNHIIRKMNVFLNQVIRILKEYPGSQLKESVLSFRIYSFPLLFSYLIKVDVSDPFQLSENSVSVKKQFGEFSASSRIRSIFKECLGNEESLITYVTRLTESIKAMEHEIGVVTNRSHIRLIW